MAHKHRQALDFIVGVAVGMSKDLEGRNEFRVEGIVMDDNGDSDGVYMYMYVGSLDGNTDEGLAEGAQEGTLDDGRYVDSTVGK